MPRFSLPDASGLTPLEFPFNPPRPFRSFGNDLPQPAPESIARFQAAMAEPPAEPDVPSTPSDGSAPITDVGRTDRIYDVPCTVLPDAESCQADAETRVERQDIGQPTTDRQVQQTTVSTPTQAPTVEALERTSAHLVGSRVPRDRPRAEHVSIPGLEIASVDVPTQARTIDQPNLLPATDDPTVKRQDDIGGTIPIVTTKVEHVTTSVEHVTTKVEHVETTPAGVARPEAAPHQADTVIRVERQYIEQPEQPTADRQVQQTTTNMRTQAPTADVPAQTPTIDEPTQPPTVEALERTSAHLVGSRVPRDRQRAEHASIPGLGTASIDVPTQARTIDQPNQLPATDDPTVKRQDDIGGTIPIVTAKVEHVDTTPAGVARPEAAPHQADTVIRVERQYIEQPEQPTADRQVQQTTVSTPTQAPTVEALERTSAHLVGSRVPRDRPRAEHAPIPSLETASIDVPAQTPTIDEPTQPPTVEALEITSAHLVGSRVPRDRPRAEHASIPSLEIASVDVPTQARTIDQPNLLPATDNPTVKRQDGIGGAIPIVTTKVEHVTTSRQVRQTTDDNLAPQAANDVPPTLQAAPVVVPATPDVAPTAVADIISIEIDPAAATAKTRELVEAAEQVADAILVTPSLVRGDGEITIRLKPTVLDGSEISMKAKGTDISVIIVPATPSVAHIVEQSKVQFEQMLAERLPTFQVAVSVQAVKTASKRKDSAA